MATLTDLLQVLDPNDPFLVRTLDSANDDIVLNVPLTLNRDAVINANLTVNGTLTATDEERVLIEDGYPYLNNGYTNTVAKTGGLVVNYLPTATADTVNGAFVAGVNAVSNPSVVTTGSGTFSTGQFIQISGAADPANNGLFEVLSHVGTALEIRGVGVTTTQEDFTQTDFVADATAQGTITVVNVSILRAGTDGVWETGSGSSSPTGTPLTFTDISSGGSTTLQTAYENGNTITTDGANGSVVIAGTEALQITATGGLDVNTVADFDVTTFDVQMTGANGFSIDGGAASNVTVANGNLTLSATGAGSDVILSAADIVDIDGTTLDLDSSAATTVNAGTTLGLTGGTGATMTATSGTAQVTAIAGEVDLTAATVVDINGASIDADATGTAAITAGTTLDLDGATVDIDGSTRVDIDGPIVSIDSTDDSNLSMTANDAAAKTLTIAASNTGAGAGNLALTADDDISLSSTTLDFNATGAATLDATSVSIDGTESSNLTVTGNSASATDVTIAATNAGAGTANVLISADDEVDITADSLDVNLGTGNATAGQVSAGGVDYLTVDSTSGDEQLLLGTFTNLAGTAGVKLTAATAITAGDVLRLDVNGQVTQADGNAPGPTGSLDGISIGVALRGALAAASVAVVTVPGCIVPVRFASAPLAASNRRPVYVSGTAGLGTLTPPAGSGSTRFIIGYLQGADGVTTTPDVLFQPQYLSRTP